MVIRGRPKLTESKKLIVMYDAYDGWCFRLWSKWFHLWSSKKQLKVTLRDEINGRLTVDACPGS